MSLECGKNRERTCKLHTEMSQSGFKPRTFLRRSIVLTTAPLFMSTFNKKQTTPIKRNNKYAHESI